MKYFSFVALAAAALATSCASDDLAEQKQEQNQNGTQTVTLTASVNEGQTRVGMTKGENSTASFYWHEADQIFVQTKNGDSYTGTAFSITGDDAKDGDTKATFTGEVTGTVGTYAVYPYNESHSFTGETTLTYNLPATYTYNKVETNIFSKTTDGTTAYPSNPTNMPMLGTISDKSISFKCLGGLAVIRIDQMPAASGTLTVSADQQLSGSFTVDLSADEATLATTSTDVTDADKKVTFNFTGAETGKVGVFYLPLATGSYSGVKITINSQTETINFGNLHVARKSVTAIPLYTTGTNNTLTKFSKIDGNVYTLNGHEFVDLGLDVLWATMNVGADNATDVGGYFSWGETTAKTDFSGSYTLPGTSTLDAAHDAATVNWGVGVRMPTIKELSALVNDDDYCEWTWDGTNNGYTLTKNSQSIFLPAAGAYSTLSPTSPQDNGAKGYYWSSTYGTFNYIHFSCYLNFEHRTDPEDTSKSTDWRYACAGGCSVRAVAEK